MEPSWEKRGLRKTVPRSSQEEEAKLNSGEGGAQDTWDGKMSAHVSTEIYLGKQEIHTQGRMWATLRERGVFGVPFKRDLVRGGHGKIRMWG